MAELLEALAEAGVLARAGGGRFAPTPLSEPLRSDHPLGVRELYAFLACEVAAWSALDRSVRTGVSAFDLVHGRSLWEHLAADAAAGRRFTATQRALTRLEARAALAARDWSGFRTVVDVGGSDGSFLASLLPRLPRLRGTLLDLPYAAAGATEVLEGAGVAGRCEVVAGSFFAGIPAGADVYLLKRVLYCWGTGPALELLRRVRAAMRPESRLLVLEPLSRPAAGFDPGSLLDVLLLVLTGAGARAPEEVEALLQAAGLRLERILPTPMLPVVEARPA
jgi:hypothetical protein